MSIFNVSIQQVVADVGGRAFHPFDGYRTFGDVEVVGEKVLRVGWRLPVELFGDVAPVGFWMFNRLFVQLLVLLE